MPVSMELDEEKESVGVTSQVNSESESTIESESARVPLSDEIHQRLCDFVAAHPQFPPDPRAQRGEPEESLAQRKERVSELLSRDTVLFLERYGKLLDSIHLQLFTDEHLVSYEVKFHVEKLRERLRLHTQSDVRHARFGRAAQASSPNSAAVRTRRPRFGEFTDSEPEVPNNEVSPAPMSRRVVVSPRPSEGVSATIRNRRLAYFRKNLDGTPFMSTDALRLRHPQLWQTYMGRYEDLFPNECASCDLADFLSGFIDRQQARARGEDPREIDSDEEDVRLELERVREERDRHLELEEEREEREEEEGESDESGVSAERLIERVDRQHRREQRREEREQRRAQRRRERADVALEELRSLAFQQYIDGHETAHVCYADIDEDEMLDGLNEEAERDLEEAWFDAD